MSTTQTITMTRVLGDVKTIALFKPPRRNAVRVRVLRGSEWVDITNRVKRGTITESNDQAMTTLDLELLNGTGFPSLAPRRADSEINQVDAVYDPLLWPGRQIKVDAASSTDGSTPDEWVPVFHGVLGDDVDSISRPNTVQIFARDQAKWLLDDHIVGPITYKNMYGSQIIEQLLIDRYSANGIPVEIPFRAIGDDDHWIEEYTIENLTTWQAIQNIVDQSGRDCRFKLDESDGVFKLTYWLPSLDMSQPDWIITGSEIRAETLRISDAQLRNRVEIAYRDAQGKKQEVVATNNQTPIRLCRIEEGDTDLIRDEASAQRFADRLLDYLQDLHATDELTVPFNPYISLFDVIEVRNPTIRTDPEYYSVDGRTLTFSLDNWELSLIASGSVGVTPQRWIDKETRPGVKRPWVPDDSTTNQPMPTPTGVQAVSIPGGISITFDEPDPKRWAETLVYVSTTTPVDMEAPPAVKGKVIPLEVPGEPGVPLYARIVHVDAYGNRSEPSAEVTATPDRVVETPDDTPPATPTGLTADFTGADLYLSWAPVDRAVRYRVRISDANGVRRERHVSGSSYTYTLADNRADGSPAQPSLTVQVWAQTQEGVYSTTPATITAINLPPAAPLIEVRSSLTQLRWEIVGNLPRDWDRVSVSVGSVTEVGQRTGGTIDLQSAGIADGAIAQVTVYVIDVFGQESQPAVGQVTVNYLDKAAFAANIRPVELVSSLPQLPNPQYPQGAIVFLTTDNKLYRSTGTAWTAEVPTTDLAGTITETQIGNDAVTTPKLKAGAVTTDKLEAGAVTADKLAANSVTAGKIAAGAVKADAIDVDELSAISADIGTVTAGIVQTPDGGAKFGEDALGSGKHGMLVSDGSNDKVAVGDISGRMWRGQPLPSGTYGVWAPDGFIAVSDFKSKAVNDASGELTSSTSWTPITDFYVDFEVPSGGANVVVWMSAEVAATPQSPPRDAIGAYYCLFLDDMQLIPTIRSVGMSMDDNLIHIVEGSIHVTMVMENLSEGMHTLDGRFYAMGANPPVFGSLAWIFRRSLGVEIYRR